MKLIGSILAGTTLALAPAAAESDPEALLAEVVASGWPRLIVPRALGGEGATHPELADALLQLRSEEHTSELQSH